MGLHPRRYQPFPLLSLALLCCGFCAIARAQSRIDDVTVHSAGLEHNLLGDPADQPVSIYLPDAYAREAQRRFPVLYFLHGYGAASGPKHASAEAFRAAMDPLIASGSVQPFIVVLPNGANKYRGAFYSNSSTLGDWEDFIVRDVVGYVDGHYRTLASPEHRGIAGHSMGGYGALTLGFRHPDVFGAVYAMSPCCTDLVGDQGPSNPTWAEIAAMKSPDDVPEALRNNHFGAAALASMTAALAPNPAKKTLGDLPFITVNGQVKTDPEAFSRIAANMPANMVFPLLPRIAQLKGIFIEYGAQENFSAIVIGAQETAQRLTQAGISNTLEVFQGDHVNHLLQRISQRMLPWMSQQIQ